MRKWRSSFLYLICLLSDLIATIPFLLIWGIWGRNAGFEKKPPMFEGGKPTPGVWCLVCSLKPEVLKFWKYSAITLAPHIIIYRDYARDEEGWSKIQDHEHVHVEQYESACLIGLVIGLLLLSNPSFWLMSLAIWGVSPWVYMGSGYAVAWIRGESLYRGSVNEEAAYSIAES